MGSSLLRCQPKQRFFFFCFSKLPTDGSFHLLLNLEETLKEMLVSSPIFFKASPACSRGRCHKVQHHRAVSLTTGH